MNGAVNAFKFKDLTRLHELGLRSREYYVAGAGSRWKIRWFTADELVPAQDDTQLSWVRLELSLATGYKIRLYLQEGLFGALLEGIEPAQFWQLDSLLRCAYFQINNQGTLNWIDQHWQCAFEVEAVDLLDTDPDYSYAVAFILSTATGLNYKPGLVEFVGIQQRYSLSALFHAVPLGREVIMAGVPLNLDIVVGRTQIPLAELRQLQRNDLILLAAGEFSSMMATLCLQGRSLFLVDIEQGLLRVKQLLRPNVMADTDTSHVGTDDAGKQGGEANPETSPSKESVQRIDPNEIEVEVHFSLGALTETLAGLEKISEGHVFELSRQPSDCVDINLNGKRLAKGEPVMIADRVGIRVVKVNDG